MKIEGFIIGASPIHPGVSKHIRTFSPNRPLASSAEERRNQPVEGRERLRWIDL